MYQCRPGLPKWRWFRTRPIVTGIVVRVVGVDCKVKSGQSTDSSICLTFGTNLSNPCQMEEDKRRRSRAGADSNCASVLAAVGSHQRPSDQVGTPGPIKCKGKVPKLINKDLLSNSRERGPLPVGPHPRLFFVSARSFQNVRFSTFVSARSSSNRTSSRIVSGQGVQGERYILNFWS